jgi:hypothetical protein
MNRNETLIIEMAQEMDMLYDFVRRAEEMSLRYVGCEILIREFPQLEYEMQIRRGDYIDET